jgi:hypothetical protein
MFVAYTQTAPFMAVPAIYEGLLIPGAAFQRLHKQANLTTCGRQSVLILSILLAFVSVSTVTSTTIAIF